MHAPLALVGTPQIVDSFFRPIARFFQVLLGLAASLALWAFGWLWWVPVPFVLSFVAYELFFWWRGDRAQTLRIDGHRLGLDDPLVEVPIAIDLREVSVATLYYRQHTDDEVEVAVALGDEQGPRFAARVLQRSPLEPGPHDVPIGVHDLMFGGVAGVFRALAPPALRPRQTFIDPDGALVARLRALVPPEAWRRTGIRLWQGMEPPIDLFGYYEGPHTDWLVLDGHDWRRGDVTGSIRGWSFASAERSAVLFQGLERRQRVDRFPLALVALGGATTIAFPAPAAPDVGPLQPLTSDLLHTHSPEGAALVWHLLVHTPRDARPSVLAEMIADRRPIHPDLERMLPG